MAPCRLYRHLGQSFGGCSPLPHAVTCSSAVTLYASLRVSCCGRRWRHRAYGIGPSVTQLVKTWRTRVQSHISGASLCSLLLLTCRVFHGFLESVPEPPGEQDSRKELSGASQQRRCLRMGGPSHLSSRDWTDEVSPGNPRVPYDLLSCDSTSLSFSPKKVKQD